MRKTKRNILLKKIYLINYIKKKIKTIILKSIVHNYNVKLNKKKIIFLDFQKKRNQICLISGQYKNWQKNIYYSRYNIHNSIKKNEFQNVRLK
jgi:hypothetical protein